MTTLARSLDLSSGLLCVSKGSQGSSPLTAAIVTVLGRGDWIASGTLPAGRNCSSSLAPHAPCLSFLSCCVLS